MISFFSSRRYWDSPTPLAAGECAPPPFGPGGGEGGHTRLRERGWGSPNSDEGTLKRGLIYSVHSAFCSSIPASSKTSRHTLWCSINSLCLLASRKPLTRESRVRIRNPVNGFRDLDPNQNVRDPEHQIFKREKAFLTFTDDF